MKVIHLFCYNHSRIKNIALVSIINLFVGISVGYGQITEITDTIKISQSVIETDVESVLEFDPAGMGYDISTMNDNIEPSAEADDGKINNSSFWDKYVTDPMRIGLSYEFAMKYPDVIRKNRLAFRMDYSKLLFGNTSVLIDAKIMTFLPEDHRARQSIYWFNDDSSNVQLSFGGKIRDAYMQTSLNNTSFKLGIQTLSWGESDFASVTDEISPMDYREPLNLNLDELKMGQLMLTIDQYTSFGNLTGFFIPFPEFNKYPQKGTAFYYDPYKGFASVTYQLEKQDGFFFEAGGRWKKTFGKSDVSVMVASLINNDYATRRWGYNITYQSKLRYSMAGITFNRAMNKFLIKGELAVKAPKPYSDRDQQIIKKNNLDASIGIDYSVNSTLSVSLEAVNYHIMDWDSEVKYATKDNYMVLLILSKLLMHNDLSVNWVTMYNGPYTAFFHLFSTSYNWTDHVSLSMDIIFPFTKDEDSGYYLYRNEKQAAFKIQYQF